MLESFLKAIAGTFLKLGISKANPDDIGILFWTLRGKLKDAEQYPGNYLFVLGITRGALVLVAERLGCCWQQADQHRWS